ncbi:putative SOS response-associated peptidase YoqW [Brevibacillus reuszeri]|uniref:SOS response-associated peptidase n=1 Tax=Brevibacillus reuszeri TaxID=54915 RepID=UPI001AFE0C3F|nr:SOS response-associated peptidase [Brevibacillus reuszeri]GIO09690.1 putative SOS response-associated peptidase YoqW [Brevibacillus reuszeri]
MCGRFTIVFDAETLLNRFDIEDIPFDWREIYNVAPGQKIPAIIEDRGERRIGQLKWGLVPFWSKDEKVGYKMINAKSETLREKPAFKNLFARKRCIIPADGFYEWKKVGKEKQPMRIMMTTGEPFAFAGLYDTWTSPEGEKLHTCTIITTKPNDVVQDIHDRMPVILKKQDEQLWLDREKFDADLLQSLLVPYDHDQMRAYPVPAMVGSPKNDLPECIQEIAADPSLL